MPSPIDRTRAPVRSPQMDRTHSSESSHVADDISESELDFLTYITSSYGQKPTSTRNNDSSIYSYSPPSSSSLSSTYASSSGTVTSDSHHSKVTITGLHPFSSGSWGKRSAPRSRSSSNVSGTTSFFSHERSIPEVEQEDESEEYEDEQEQENSEERQQQDEVPHSPSPGSSISSPDRSMRMKRPIVAMWLSVRYKIFRMQRRLAVVKSRKPKNTVVYGYY